MERATLPFKDRTDAGQRLAEKLKIYEKDRPLILALPRGGVPVGYEVARDLKAPLDTVVARKIGAPFNPEYGVGAIAPGDVLVLDNRLLQILDLRTEDLDPIIDREMEEMDRRMVRYKSGEYAKNIQANTIIIIDDGLATGVTARAAIESVKITWKPQRIIFAAPICSRETAEFLRDLVDEVVCVAEVDNLAAIGFWYQEFSQTTDEEVLNYLERMK